MPKSALTGGGPFEPFHRSNRQIATGGLPCLDLARRHQALFGLGAPSALGGPSMTANAENVLITCRRCRAWPMAIHTRSRPRQGILPTLLICKRCGHTIEGPEIHDEQPLG
jgi:hypothetical protein